MSIYSKTEALHDSKYIAMLESVFKVKLYLMKYKKHLVVKNLGDNR